MHRMYFLPKLFIVHIQLYNSLYTRMCVNVYVPNHVYGVLVYVHVEVRRQPCVLFFKCHLPFSV